MLSRPQTKKILTNRYVPFAGGFKEFQLVTTYDDVNSMCVSTCNGYIYPNKLYIMC